MKDDQQEWDSDSISDLFNEKDRELIQQILIPETSRADTWFWSKEDKR